MALTEAGDLIVEDETGIDDANSYTDIATVDAYHHLRDNTVWTEATEHDKVAALIIATQYVDQRWSYQGAISFEDAGSGFPQALLFPRGPLVDSRGLDVSDTVPQQILDATAEYALRALKDGGGSQQLVRDPVEEDESGRSVTEKLEKIGPMTESTKYSTSRGRRKFLSYPIPDDIVRRSGFPGQTGESVVRG